MLHLYNTKTRKKEVFTPINPRMVRLYACGPTIYDHVHIGNGRPLIIFDILFRILRKIYGDSNVLYIRNLTDVDDKINQRAAKIFPELSLNQAIAKLTETTNAQFQADLVKINCLAPTKQPRASHYIAQMRNMIDHLLAQGHAYIEQDHVLFSVASMPEGLPYGAFSRIPLEEICAGARVEIASYKRDPRDFVLWKPSTIKEPAWPSPGGITTKGRPGWHIECSAMSMAELIEPFGGGFDQEGEKNSFDIHAGGIDLIFPHHENEIAQSCCALKTKTVANYWVHNGYVLIDGQKMSKSLGNFLTIHELLYDTVFEKFSNDPMRQPLWMGLGLRSVMLQTHYRAPLNWSSERFKLAIEELCRWYHALEKHEAGSSIDDRALEPFFAALEDDLNTPLAFFHLRKFVTEKNWAALKTALKFLGLWPEESLAFLLEANITKKRAISEAEIAIQIAERALFLEEKSWAEADKIRDNLLEKGVQLEDSKDKATGKRKTKWRFL